MGSLSFPRVPNHPCGNGTARPSVPVPLCCSRSLVSEHTREKHASTANQAGFRLLWCPGICGQVKGSAMLQPHKDAEALLLQCSPGGGRRRTLEPLANPPRIPTGNAYAGPVGDAATQSASAGAPPSGDAQGKPQEADSSPPPQQPPRRAQPDFTRTSGVSHTVAPPDSNPLPSKPTPAPSPTSGGAARPREREPSISRRGNVSA
jgi:hypothetical protein